MSKNLELVDALNQVAKEKGIDKEVIFEAIETALVSACKKNFGAASNIKVEIDRETAKVDVYALKTVVEEVSDDSLEISLDDARILDISHNVSHNVGDVVNIVVTPKNFGRISAQTAKQVVVQKFREAERDIMFNEYVSKEKQIVTGIVQRKERKNVIIAMGKIDAVLPQNEQIPKEEYAFQDRIKVYVVEVKKTSKGPLINVSRTHPELVRKLFEQEVPEVYDKIVEIKSISREAGSRTKIAVYSNNKDVDPVGACVGQNGYRVNIIVSELNGEKIDVVNYNEDPKIFIAEALSPCKVLAVTVNNETQSAKIVVPDHQLSLAIGKEGQNARLAAKLTGYRIDIKSESQAKATSFIDESEYIDPMAEKPADQEDIDSEDMAEGLDNNLYENGYEELDESFDEDAFDDELDDNNDDSFDEDYDDDLDYEDEDGAYDREDFDEDFDEDFNEDFDGDYEEAYDEDYDDEFYEG